jgi:hypothetical protein
MLVFAMFISGGRVRMSKDSGKIKLGGGVSDFTNFFFTLLLGLYAVMCEFR